VKHNAEACVSEDIELSLILPMARQAALELLPSDGVTSQAALPTPGAPGSVFQRLVFPLFLAGVAVCLYRLLFVFPAIPYTPDADGPGFLYDAMRMVAGNSLYANFDQVLFPGTDDFYYAIVKIFGARAWIPAILLVIVGVAFAAAAVSMARRVVSGFMVYVPAILFLAIAFRTRLDATHHWFSVAFVTAAALVLLPQRSASRVLVAGILCAFAAWFTQTRGAMVVAGISVFLAWESILVRRSVRQFIRVEMLFLFAFSFALIALTGYHFWKVGPAVFYEQTFTNVLSMARYRPHNTFEKYMLWQDFTALADPLPKAIALTALQLCLYLLIPAIYILTLVRVIFVEKSWASNRRLPVVLITLLGLAEFVTIAPAPGLVRLPYGSVYAFVLLTWYLSSNVISRSSLQAFAVGMILFMAYFCRPSPYTVLNLPSGRVAFHGSDAAPNRSVTTFAWLAAHTKPGDFVYEPSWWKLYFLLHVQNPSPVFFLANDKSATPDKVVRSIAGLQSHPVRFILWDPVLDASYGDLSSDYLGPLRDYRTREYRMVRSFPDSLQLWEKRDLRFHAGLPGAAN
jgi:hypothetical protein